MLDVNQALGDKMADPSLTLPDAIFHEQGRLQRFRFSNNDGQTITFTAPSCL